MEENVSPGSESCHQYVYYTGINRLSHCNFNNHRGIQNYAVFRWCIYLHFGATVTQATTNPGKLIFLRRQQHAEIFNFLKGTNVPIISIECHFVILSVAFHVFQDPLWSTRNIYITVSENSLVKLRLTTLVNSFGTSQAWTKETDGASMSI